MYYYTYLSVLSHLPSRMQTLIGLVSLPFMMYDYFMHQYLQLLFTYVLFWFSQIYQWTNIQYDKRKYVSRKIQAENQSKKKRFVYYQNETFLFLFIIQTWREECTIVHQIIIRHSVYKLIWGIYARTILISA